MILPIRIQHYQQAKSNVTLPGEEKWVDKWDVCVTCDSAESAKKLKEALSKREWQGLTLEEILETYRGPNGSDYVDYAEAIEAKLKDKNT
jgi:hypothetical protein